MLIESKKDKSEFSNKYWMGSNMASALSQYAKNHDVECILETPKIMSSIFFYCDDLSENELIDIYNNSPYLNNISEIHSIEQKYFDDYEFGKNSQVTQILSKYDLPNLVKVCAD